MKLSGAVVDSNVLVLSAGVVDIIFIGVVVVPDLIVLSIGVV